MSGDNSALDVVLVTQLPPDGWFEGFAIRPSNHILVPDLNSPVVYDLDPEDPDSEPQIVYTFPDVVATLNLCPVPGRADTYTVLTADFCDLAASRWEGFAVWQLDLSAPASPKAAKTGDLKDIVLPLGLCPVAERFALVADSTKACISVLDVTKGTSTTLLTDKASMEPQGENGIFGINRLSIAGGYIWYSNFSGGTIHRAPYKMEPADGQTPLRIVGPVELVTDNLIHCDGFHVSSDGKTAYTANCLDGCLVETDLTKVGGGGASSKQVLDRLISPTCLEIGTDANGKRKVFVICCGEIEVGWMTGGPSWKDIANATVATVEVTVSTE
ncbi:hypothetical protein JX265_010408 [Neoarthrinium moseri]|uniref:SMP-30/Gluconolactonase/LRE-like region domain-containing protein n=1 Tax=Neoarthrinium moseri TaxID=1658444 RepID=A0A9P9WE98_9PEZI|nr:uncharacterized protein JN550_012482 [Neoarthrinium moseri]KAI1842434.1 hypothetical protein JX266_011329 [Neoarthrinium moseri]KAI1858732.1 hypothetical protein JN550_012482 [Neoarthrinium moseri]KAI1859405.1 hypothetical protein JX265_010408 [Neoarthrinium moseri]